MNLFSEISPCLSKLQLAKVGSVFRHSVAAAAVWAACLVKCRLIKFAVYVQTAVWAARLVKCRLMKFTVYVQTACRSKRSCQERSDKAARNQRSHWQHEDRASCSWAGVETEVGGHRSADGKTCRRSRTGRCCMSICIFFSIIMRIILMGFFSYCTEDLEMPYGRLVSWDRDVQGVNCHLERFGLITVKMQPLVAPGQRSDLQAQISPVLLSPEVVQDHINLTIFLQLTKN